MGVASAYRVLGEAKRAAGINQRRRDRRNLL
jgi:hypothetical protein